MDYIEQMEREENLKRLMVISKANELVTEMQHEVDKYTELLELAKEKRVYTITHNVNYFQFLFRILGAMDYFRENQDKRSKEYKESKSMLESLQKCLEEVVFKKPVSITNIYSGGYEGYYEEVEFTIPDSELKFSFTVPNSEKINVKNFEYANLCMLSFGYYSSSSVHNIVKSFYDVNEITEAFKKFMMENKQDENTK